MFDVNNRDRITAQDVLIVVNRINALGTGPLPAPSPPQDCPPDWYDVDGDDTLTAADVLES